MKTTNNTMINSIAKYICAVLMVLGVSVNVWGTDHVDQTLILNSTTMGLTTTNQTLSTTVNGISIATSGNIKYETYSKKNYIIMANNQSLKNTTALTDNIQYIIITDVSDVSKIKVYGASSAGATTTEITGTATGTTYKYNLTSYSYKYFTIVSKDGSAYLFETVTVYSGAVSFPEVTSLSFSGTTDDYPYTTEYKNIKAVVTTSSEYLYWYNDTWGAVDYIHVSGDEIVAEVGTNYNGSTSTFYIYNAVALTNYSIPLRVSVINPGDEWIHVIFRAGEGDNSKDPGILFPIHVVVTPTCSTPTVSNSGMSVSATSSSSISISGGKVTDNGGCAITQHGYVYNTTGNPTWSDSKVGWNTGIAVNTQFGSGIKSGLTPGTTYYVRPVAYNGTGRGYGDQLTVKTMYAVTLDDGLVATTNNGSASVADNATSIVAITPPTKTGYHVEGYYTTNGGSLKIATDEGALQNGSGSGITVGGNAWTNSSSQWTRGAGETFYAKWTGNEYIVAFDKNDNDATGSMEDQEFVYGTAQTLTACGFTKEGYTFAGWATTPSGSKAYDDEESVDNLTSVENGIVTLYAKWTVNSYKLAVASPANVTISVTSPSALAEGADPIDVNYGTTVTLNYGSISSGTAWNDWNVYKTGDATTTVTVNGSNQFTMPAHNVTVDAKMFATAKMKTRCLQFDVDGEVWLTSYAGQEVFTTDAPENRITITCDDWGDADRMYVSYYNGAGESVAKASSLFRVCDASTYGKVDASNDYFAISGTGHASGVKYAISYQPGASEYEQDDIWTIRFTAKSGASIVLGYKDFVVQGRALPQYFAIVSKYNDKWYALPNTIVSNTASITPIEVTVDNTTTPTAVTYAPTTVKYKGGSRYAAGTHRYAIGILDPSDNKLKTSKDKTYVYTGSGSATYQDWYLESTDFGAYTMWVPSDDSEVSPKKMGISSGKIGYFASPDSPSEQIYLLPVTNWLTPNEAKVTEWGQKSVILDVDAQSPIVSAQAHFGDRESAEEAASFGQTRTSVANGASKYNYTLTFTTTDFSEHKGELLYIDWLDGESAVQSTSAVSIPWIIAENGKMSEIDSDKDHWKDAEVHVLPGVTLEADGGNFANKVVAINTLEIYPGATVEVTKGDNDRGSLNPSNLILRNGWTRAGNKEYNVARLYISTDNASVTKPSKAYSDWYIDFDQYYPIAVPWTVTTSGMSYLNSSSAVSAGVKMRYYDGASRATNVQAGVGESVNWKEFSRTVEETIYKYPETLTPGIGYAMTARRPTGKAFSIIRMPLTIPSSDWLANGEQGVVSDTHKDQVTVTAHDSGTTPEYAKGWNFVANPYMSLYKGTLSYAADDDIAYANIPDINFKEYDQVPIDATTKLKPSSGFLIQAPKNGTATFAAGSSTLAAAAPSIHRNAKESTTPTQKAYVVLRGANTEDMMGIWIADKYTEAYESNADLQKLLGDGTSLKTYMLYRDMEMAYLAINSVLAQEWIPIIVRIPSSGEYTFSLHKASILGEVERVSLIDYSNGQITNLMTDNYSFTSTSGTISGRFAINTVVGQRETPTDIDIIQGGGDLNSKEPFKFLYRDKVYIYHRGVIYDTTGKKVKVINK